MADWLQVEALCFAHGEATVFDRLSFAVGDADRVVSLVGPSGVGKTTLISLIAGLLSPLQGRVSFQGRSVGGPSPSRPVVFQNYNLFPWMTVLDNVGFPLKCRGVSREERRGVARDLLTRMKLSGTEALFPSALSGGMQQRVGLARALSLRPDCILMDEPFSAVDTPTKEALFEDLMRQATEGNQRMVLVTHDMADAVFLSDRVVRLVDKNTVHSCAIEAPARPRLPAFRYTDEFRDQVRALETP